MDLKNHTGLRFEFLENGSVRTIEAAGIRINLKPGTPFSPAGTNIFLRKRTYPVSFIPLLGPESNSRFRVEKGRYIAAGSWWGLDYRCTLKLSDKSNSWQWQVEVQNNNDASEDLDLVYLQDIALKPAGPGPVNEYYVSQYLERRILEDPSCGAVICCRQNTKEKTGHPWLMLACPTGAATGTTDGILFFGKRYRETGIPEGLLAEELGGEYAGESSVLALQCTPFILEPGSSHNSSMVGIFQPDHPAATSAGDLHILPSVMEEFRPDVQWDNSDQWNSPRRNHFNRAAFLTTDELTEEELTVYFGKERRHAEWDDGQLLSFFTGDHDHVVLHAKEMLTDRPHGHILQSRPALVPDERILSTTAFAFGVFNSHVTQGNTNFNVLLSICTSQFNQTRETGQRILVKMDGRHFLLGVPSAFEMGMNHCRWIYKYGLRVFQVRTWTSASSPQVNTEFSVLSGGAVEVVVTHELDRSGEWRTHSSERQGEYIFRPGPETLIGDTFPDAQFRIIVQSGRFDPKVKGDGILHDDGQDIGSSLFVLDFPASKGFCLSLLGEVSRAEEPVLIADADAQWSADRRAALTDWQSLSMHLALESENEDLLAIREILPWYGQNALVHYLTPYGLEQFGGAAWGTRDVAQGPVELLLTLERYDEARKVLCTIFSNQNYDGGWPQWWMFDSYRQVRADEAHGDIHYWCIIALSNYIRVTGDLAILDEMLPYYQAEGPDRAQRTPLRKHVERLIDMITGSFIPGKALVPFGGGDWNDSLQPVSEELAGRLISSWTVEMNYQAFMQYRDILLMDGHTDKARELGQVCDRIKDDFNRYLVRDGVVAGYGRLEDDGSIELLLHPTDRETGLRYSLLPMERGILSGIFTKAQADRHRELIEKHLKGPDGARLMDRPLKYKGGIQEIFRRAESSTFFGREIGLMYVHEHIRYAELLAVTGQADAFVKALRQTIPVGYRDIVPKGDHRQSNCYYSSSDVAFRNRYEADEQYQEVLAGNYPLKGGWRVYSSGPGIFIGIIITRLLGLRVEATRVIIDPVMTHTMDGLSATLLLLGHRITFTYSVKGSTHGPGAIVVNGQQVPFVREQNHYRTGGAVIEKDKLKSLFNKKENTIVITL